MPRFTRAGQFTNSYNIQLFLLSALVNNFDQAQKYHFSYSLLTPIPDQTRMKKHNNFLQSYSYLFSWHKEKMIFKDIRHESFSADFTDNLLLGLLRRIQVCIQQYGELGCLYQTHGEDGNLEVSIVHSVLVCYACCL